MGMYRWLFQSSHHRGMSRDLTDVCHRAYIAGMFQSSHHRGMSRDGALPLRAPRSGSRVSILSSSRHVERLVSSLPPRARRSPVSILSSSRHVERRDGGVEPRRAPEFQSSHHRGMSRDSAYGLRITCSRVVSILSSSRHVERRNDRQHPSRAPRVSILSSSRHVERRYYWIGLTAHKTMFQSSHHRGMSRDDPPI